MPLNHSGFEVEKPLVTFHLDRCREVPWSSQLKIKIEKALNRPRFQGREAPWLPSIQIEVEKPLGLYNSRLR